MHRQHFQRMADLVRRTDSFEQIVARYGSNDEPDDQQMKFYEASHLLNSLCEAEDFFQFRDVHEIFTWLVDGCTMSTLDREDIIFSLRLLLHFLQRNLSAASRSLRKTGACQLLVSLLYQHVDCAEVVALSLQIVSALVYAHGASKNAELLGELFIDRTLVCMERHNTEMHLVSYGLSCICMVVERGQSELMRRVGPGTCASEFVSAIRALLLLSKAASAKTEDAKAAKSGIVYGCLLLTQLAQLGHVAQLVEFDAEGTLLEAKLLWPTSSTLQNAADGALKLVHAHKIKRKKKTTVSRDSPVPVTEEDERAAELAMQELLNEDNIGSNHTGGALKKKQSKTKRSKKKTAAKVHGHDEETTAGDAAEASHASASQGAAATAGGATQGSQASASQEAAKFEAVEAEAEAHTVKKKLEEALEENEDLDELNKNLMVNDGLMSEKDELRKLAEQRRADVATTTIAAGAAVAAAAPGKTGTPVSPTLESDEQGNVVAIDNHSVDAVLFGAPLSDIESSTEQTDRRRLCDDANQDAISTVAPLFEPVVDESCPASTLPTSIESTILGVMEHGHDDRETMFATLESDEQGNVIVIDNNSVDFTTDAVLLDAPVSRTETNADQMDVRRLCDDTNTNHDIVPEVMMLPAEITECCLTTVTESKEDYVSAHPAAVGLESGANLCFVNVAVQALYRLGSFRSMLRTSSASAAPLPCSLAGALTDVFDALEGTSLSGDDSTDAPAVAGISANAVQLVMQGKHDALSKFTSGTQEDASLLLFAMFEQLDLELGLNQKMLAAASPTNSCFGVTTRVRKARCALCDRYPQDNDVGELDTLADGVQTQRTTTCPSTVLLDAAAQCCNEVDWCVSTGRRRRGSSNRHEEPAVAPSPPTLGQWLHSALSLDPLECKFVQRGDAPGVKCGGRVPQRRVLLPLGGFAAASGSSATVVRDDSPISAAQLDNPAVCVSSVPAVSTVAAPPGFGALPSDNTSPAKVDDSTVTPSWPPGFSALPGDDATTPTISSTVAPPQQPASDEAHMVAHRGTASLPPVLILEIVRPSAEVDGTHARSVASLLRSPGSVDKGVDLHVLFDADPNEEIKRAPIAGDAIDANLGNAQRQPTHHLDGFIAFSSSHYCGEWFALFSVHFESSV